MVRSRGVHEGYLQMRCSGSKLLYGLASASNLIFFLYTVSVTQVATWEVYEKELFFRVHASAACILDLVQGYHFLALCLAFLHDWLGE